MATTDLPLVLPCRGGTSATRLAEEVAEALARLGAAETTGDVEVAVAAARQGRRVVALDGCESACRARLLEARRARTRPGVNLSELDGYTGASSAADVGRLALEAADRLRRRRPPSPRSRPRIRRPAVPSGAPASKRAHDVDDYLLAIDALSSTSVECGAVAADAPTLAAHVSLLLAVSRPSAGEALARLRARGLVARGVQKEIVLTPRGRLAADRIVRRQRLLERFAVDYLGYLPHECFEQARVLDRAFDDEAIERLCDRLGRPERCPHGWPVDPVVARAENGVLVTLLAVPVGIRATVVRIVERDDALVRRLFEAGVVPGVEVVVERRSERFGVSLRAGTQTREVDVETATAAFVESTEPGTAV